MARGLIAGLDAGTTSVKVLVMTPEGEQVALGRARTTWTATPYGEETTAEGLAATARAALADAARQLEPGDRVLSIGVASMAESGVLVDAHDQPIAPVIAWHDHRDTAELDDLMNTFGAQRFSQTTGLPTWTQWSLTKHRWMRTHLPHTAAAVRRYNVADWIVRSLGADPVNELSLAARTGWLRLQTATPWQESLDWSGAPSGVLGTLVKAGTAVGHARADGELGGIDGAVLTVAGHDHQVAAIGLGAHRPGDEFDSAGTAEAILRTCEPGLAPDVVGRLAADGVTVGWHAAPGRWCLLGATQGGLVLGKVMDALAVDRSGLAALDTAALGAGQAAAPDAAEQPAALTLGPGAGDVTVRDGADPGRVWREAVEGVTRQAAALSDSLTRASGPRRDLVVAGGWTNSRALMAAKRELLGELRVSSVPEAGCRGAALLAGVAAGIYDDLDGVPT